MIRIDGSFGEGGGQVLRTSLALALVTGKAFRIDRIRAGRPKCGLMRQHLTAVEAAAAVGLAQVEGAGIGSLDLTFVPQTVRPGDYHFAVGTAGSTSLVLQTILPALLTAGGRSTITLEGGTHNPFAPPYDFLDLAFLPVIRRMGPDVRAVLDRPGFYPAGGGRVQVTIEPATGLAGLEIVSRGTIRRRLARARVAQLPADIGHKELQVVKGMLGWGPESLQCHSVEGSSGPGNVLTLEIETDAVTEVFTAFGAKGKAADKVAVEAVEEVRQYLAAGVPVGPYLADQLMIPMAMAGQGRYRTVGLTRHAATNLEIIRQFLDVDVTVDRVAADCFEVVFKKG